MLIEGAASLQEFRRFARVSVPPLSYPSYAPDRPQCHCLSGLRNNTISLGQNIALGDRFSKSLHSVVTQKVALIYVFIVDQILIFLQNLQQNSIVTIAILSARTWTTSSTRVTTCALLMLPYDCTKQKEQDWGQSVPLKNSSQSWRKGWTRPSLSHSWQVWNRERFCTYAWIADGTLSKI